MIAALLIAALVAVPSQGLIDESSDAFRAGRYEEALIGFTKVFEGRPDQPRLLWNIGRCLEELGRTDEALEKFEKYLGVETEDRAGLRAALTKVATLRAARKPKHATLRVETEPSGAHVIVDGEMIGASPVLLEVPEGDHLIAATLPGYMRAEIEVSPTAGQAAVISLTLKDMPRETSPPMAGASKERPITWLAPAVLGVVGVIFTALAVNAFLDSGEHDDDAATVQGRADAGELATDRANALSSDASDRAAFHGALGWTFATGAAATMGWAGWKILAGDARVTPQSAAP